MDKFQELNNGLNGWPMIIAGIPAEYATTVFTDNGTPVNNEDK